MFGVNDNQDTSSQTNPADSAGPAPLPPSPFMDPADVPAPGPTADPNASSVPDSAPAPAPAAQNEDALVSIKEQALNNLAPLVNHLDQTAEEKFKTTMMLIQASDNSSLVKEAYEAAQQITDEKARAQALLDVVNEINYFTQKDKA
jgi:hypothetical protein